MYHFCAQTVGVFGSIFLKREAGEVNLKALHFGNAAGALIER